MKKLSAIFETVDTSIGKRQQYLADMLVESFLYERKLVESKSELTLQEIETLIAEEAIATGSVKKADIFLDGIHSKIDEGFKDLVKTAYKKVKAFVMSFLTSNVEKAITAFNNTIKTEKAKLISEALLIYEVEDAGKKPDEADAGKKPDDKKLQAEANALINLMKKSQLLNFAPVIATKPLVDKTVVLKANNFGSLKGFSVSLTSLTGIINITLLSSDNKIKIPLVVIDPAKLTITVGNKDVKSPIALAVITSIMNHLKSIDKSIIGTTDVKLFDIALTPSEVKTIKVVQFNIGDTPTPKASEETPTTDPKADETPVPEKEDEAKQKALITELITLATAKETPELTKLLLAFTEADLDGFVEYAKDTENPKNILSIIEKFKDEKTLVKELNGIKAIIDADLNKNGVVVAQALVDSKNIIAPKRTGMTKPGVRKYSVTRKGATAILNIGDDKDNMVPVFVYNRPAKIIAFYMDPKVFDSIPKNKFLADVLEGFMGTEGEEIITDGFQKKFKGATPTATAIKVNFGGMKTVKAEGTGIFTLKNEKLVYKAGNALTAMGAATEEIETVEGATEIATDTETPEEEKGKEGKKDKKKEAELSQAMKQFQIVLTKANFKGNLGALSKSLGISPTETEKHLLAFAGKYQGNIPEILSASKLVGGKYAPLTENEFLAYMASLQSILIALSTEFHKAENSKAWLPSMYSKKSYSAFLASAITAADVLNDVVNSDMKPAKDKKPTRKEDSTVKASQYETLAKDHPKVAESLTKAFGGKKAKAQQLLMYAIEIDKMKAHINMETLPNVIDTNPKFFNGANIEDKIAFVGNLYAEGATIEQINGILTAILYNGIENNFREVEPFKHAIDAIVYVKENGSTPESFKKIESSAFDQSKF